METNGPSGKHGRYFSVRKSASEKGLSSDTLGRLNEGTTPSAFSVDRRVLALHVRAVVRVEFESFRVARFADNSSHEYGRKFGRFFSMYLPADDAPTVHVDD